MVSAPAEGRARVSLRPTCGWQRNSHLAPLRNLQVAPPRPTRRGLFEPHEARAESGKKSRHGRQ